MPRPARITIHSNALRHNLKQVRKAAPQAKLMPAIKADAYGHRAISTAETLHDLADGFLLACLSEALALRDAGINKPLMVIQGPQSQNDLVVAADKNIRLVIHNETQLILLDDFKSHKKVSITLKIDTGMHRLGLKPELAQKLHQQLKQQATINPNIWLMSHFACADELDKSTTQQQIECFDQNTHSIEAPQTLANSAGILAWPDSHRDWVRPGIMLYGSSPFATIDRETYKLRATMTLSAPLIAIHSLQKGDAIGYGSTWACPENMQVGVVACGYADGYPRHISSGTPVWLNGHHSQILGRVSMDLIVIDLRNITAKMGDNAELWGENNNIDTVAKCAETISYELLCHAGNSCKRTIEH